MQKATHLSILVPFAPSSNSSRLPTLGKPASAASLLAMAMRERREEGETAADRKRRSDTNTNPSFPSSGRWLKGIPVEKGKSQGQTAASFSGKKKKVVQKIREGEKSHCLCVCYCRACPPSICFSPTTTEALFCLSIRHGEGHGGGGGVRKGKKKKSLRECFLLCRAKKEVSQKKGSASFTCWLPLLEGTGKELERINCCLFSSS